MPPAGKLFGGENVTDPIGSGHVSQPILSYRLISLRHQRKARARRLITSMALWTGSREECSAPDRLSGGSAMVERAPVEIV
jgi:hypothetical protein